MIAAINAAGGPTYDYREIAPENIQDGGQPGANIRVGYIFNPARVTFVDRGSGDATTAVTVTTNASGTVELSLSPGRIDPTNSAFNESRKPLAAEFEFNGEKVYVVNAHFNSKSGDDALFGGVQPPQRPTEVQRQAIAEVVNSFVDDILAAEANANVVVLGDLNDFHFSPAISDTLTDGVLTNLMGQLPDNDKYTFIFDGNSQTLDHILVSNSLLPGAEFDIVHTNINFPASAAASDHDPVVARVFVGQRLIYLPVIQKSKSASLYPGVGNNGAGANNSPRRYCT